MATQEEVRDLFQTYRKAWREYLKTSRGDNPSEEGVPRRGLEQLPELHDKAIAAHEAWWNGIKSLPQFPA